ncbi:MAG: MBL fold metallo-hydrolase [Treponema sp.]|nr:MBL fold metallo-hydrolase [Treponema sp.]
MKMTILGSGTSHGIPCIACSCSVCQSKDARDKRTRCSAFVENKNADGTTSHILIDIGPDFRMQALKNNITALDAILLTHSHADHLHGLDDIRVFSHTVSRDHIKNPSAENATSEGIALYANNRTVKDVEHRFDYIFKKTQIGGGKPKIRLERQTLFERKMPPEFGDIIVTPIPMMHGSLETTGYLLTVNNGASKRHSIAYLTDCSFISDKSIQKIRECGGIIDHCVIDGLREKPHATHFSYLQAMDVAEKIKSRHTWFTHICHLKSHIQIQEYIADHLKNFPTLSKMVNEGGSVDAAYDGLTLEI